MEFTISKNKKSKPSKLSEGRSDEASDAVVSDQRTAEETPTNQLIARQPVAFVVASIAFAIWLTFLVYLAFFVS